MIARQIRALIVLLWRHWTRRALRPGEPPKRGFPSTFILNLLAVAYFLPLAWNAGNAVAGLGAARLAGAQLGLWGLALLNTASAFTLLQPEMGRVRSPLRHMLLDELPLSPFAIMFVTWLQGAFFFLVALGYLVGLCPHLHGSLVLFTLLLSGAACAWGMALVSLARAYLAAHLRRKLAFIHVAVLLVGMAAAFLSPKADHFHWLPLHDPMRWLGEALLLGVHRRLSYGSLLLAGAAGLAVTALCELRGYDRLEAAPPRQARSATSGPLTMAGVERLMSRRESGRRMLMVAILIGGLTAVLLVLKLRETSVVATAAGQLVYLCIMLSINFSAVMVKRDVSARPFLSALPLAPHQTIDGKIGALRRRLMPLALFALPFAWLLLPALGWFSVAWHFAVFVVALWLLCGAAVAVSFLSEGLGAGASVMSGTSGSFATILLGFPVYGACLAPNVFSAVVSLAMLAAIQFEARRSALRCVRWLDDAGDVERDTAVWRALLVLAAFFATQGLTAQLLKLFGWTNSSAMAVVYGVATVVLLLLVHQQRDNLPQIRWRLPRNKFTLLAGLLGGATSGALTLVGVKLLLRLHWMPLDLTEERATWGLLVAAVLMAPLAEELFFRGWLQSAIAAELAPEKRRRAVVYAALAFAAVHVGSLYVPQLMLGLLAGALYLWSGSLVPGILAHAAHNAVALLFGS